MTCPSGLLAVLRTASWTIFSLRAQHAGLAGLVDRVQGTFPEPAPCRQQGVVGDEDHFVGALCLELCAAELLVDLAAVLVEHRLDVCDCVRFLAKHDLAERLPPRRCLTGPPLPRTGR